MDKKNILILVLGIVLFIISYVFDSQVRLLFEMIEFPILDVFLSITTNFGVIFTITLLIPSLIFYKKNKKLVYTLWLSFIASVIFAFIIKLIFLRQRPMEAFTYPFTNIISYSFPSGHSMAVFSLLPILIKSLPKQRYFWIIFSFLVAISRIYFSFHFLSDVMFGALFGYFIGIFLLDLYEKGKLWKI